VCLWLLYFRAAAPAAERRLVELRGAPRAWLARDAGTFLHFPLVAGVIYIAVGIEEVLTQVSGPNATAALGWMPLIALYGGAAIYLGGRTAIIGRATRSASTVQLIAVGVPLLLLPVARALPALAALGLITVALVGLALYEAVTPDERGPA